MNWLRRFITGVFALAITSGIIGGAPVLLYRVAGNPLPKRVPSVDQIIEALTSQDNGTLFMRILAIAGWLAWATFTISVLIEIPFALKGRRARRIPGLKAQQRIAAALVGAMIAIFAGSSLASAKVAPVPARQPAVVAMQAAPQALAPQTFSQQAAAEQVYVVAKGDYLGRISQRFTGDFESYRDIAALNPKLIRNPNHIQPGWRLVLPSNASDRGVMSHATGQVITPAAPAQPTQPAPTQPAPTQPAPTPPVVPSPSVRPTLPPSPTSAAQTPASQAPQQQQQAPKQDESKDDNGASKGLAAGAGLAAASVLAAHVIVHRQQVRQRRQPKVRRRRPAGIFLPPAQMLAADRAVAKHRAADRLDAAMRRLALGMRGRPAQDMPDIAAAWQNGGDLAIILTAECPHPPEPFEERWHNTWSLPSTVKLPEASWAPSPLPGLLTFATWPQGGELLVDGERTGLLSITGDPHGGDDLLRSLAAEAATAPWADGASVLIAGFNSLDTRSLLALNPARMRAAVSIPDALNRIGKRAAANAAILAESHIHDTLLARINNMTEASWLTHLLFVADPWGEYTSALRALDEQLAGLRRVGVAVFATHPTATRWSATVGMDGGLHMGWLAVTGATARQLSSDQLAAHAESEL
ncbi:LysM peptidoglycan-binding domain-containing protein [Catelliglobosispora koreensis]|uniref:LysM peptidoglycan-binding domain-containing protein n=1 Tax=Catelliglobosispora koreensis TaxID=129052 RepID=UPI00037BE69A|nr:LysM peptidoglycan-binding domain-containing protein [Catelliglobosispora koreensis]